MTRVSAFETAHSVNTIRQAQAGRSPANMTAFLKIDGCKDCHRHIPWEWMPAMVVGQKPMAGTGVWRSQLMDDRCPPCAAALEAKRQSEQRALAARMDLVRLLGGERPYRQFTFEGYDVTAGNQVAFGRSKNFDPASENLYLWGACGVGKTHLACACARHCFEETLSVEILLAGQLSRKVRMREPDQEQTVIDQFVRVDVLALDDLGKGTDSAFARLVLQEILDGRDFRDRGGLIVTSQYSPDALANKLGDDAIPSRLVGMCSVIEIRGEDARLTIQKDRV